LTDDEDVGGPFFIDGDGKHRDPIDDDLAFLVVPCHCTGERAVEKLRQALGERVLPGSAGATYTFGRKSPHALRPSTNSVSTDGRYLNGPEPTESDGAGRGGRVESIALRDVTADGPMTLQ
jgi:hypothetical protein